MKMGKTIKITKIEESPDPYTNHIPIGKEVTGAYMEDPEVGACFYVGLHWRTSVVQEIIDSNTFRTSNSIYHYEFV